MGADQKVELQPADPEEIRTGGDPTVTQEQINTTPDRLLGRRRILRDTREKIGSLLPFNTLNRIKKSPYAKPFWEIGTRLGLATLLAFTSVEAFQRYLTPNAEATSPLTLTFDGYHIKTGEVLIQDNFQPIQAFNLSERYLSPFPLYPHLEGRPDIRLDQARILWQFVYFKDQPQYQVEAMSPSSREILSQLNQGALIPFNYTFGMNVQSDILPNSYQSQKNSTEYASIGDVAYEAIRQQGLEPRLSYHNGVYTTFAVLYLADEKTYDQPYFGNAGGTSTSSDGKPYGVFLVTGDKLKKLSVLRVYVIIAHEYKHSLGQLYHSRNPLDIMFFAGSDTDTTPLKFGPEDSRIAGGQQIFAPVTLAAVKS